MVTIRLRVSAPQRETAGAILSGTEFTFGGKVKREEAAKFILTREGRVLSRVLAVGMVTSLDRERGAVTIDDGSGQLVALVAGEVWKAGLPDLREGDIVQVWGKLRRTKGGGTVLLGAGYHRYEGDEAAAVFGYHLAEIVRQRRKDVELNRIARQLLERNGWDYLKAKRELGPYGQKGLTARHLIGQLVSRGSQAG